MVGTFQDEARRLSTARAGREELEAQFQRDRAALDRLGTSGWEEDEAEAEQRTSRVGAGVE